MRKYLFAVLAALLSVGLVGGIALAASEGENAPAPAAQSGQEGCLACHAGIEDIMPAGNPMMQQIQALGACTTCHGGDPAVTDDAAVAHGPEGSFYPDPGSPWVVDKTCGKCHAGYGRALSLSLMNTEAGKIQGNLWAWGVQEDQIARYGNYDLQDDDGPTPAFGSDAYKAYMEDLVARFPGQFPSSMEQLPNPTVEEIAADPSLAGYTYLRNQCQRCHVGVPGRQRRGDYSGMGCSACHIPYSNDGFYEGNDPAIPKDEPGHPLRHSIQATREISGGIPVESCNSCHNRGKRIGVSYEGIMEFPYGTPFGEEGDQQPKLHTKKYLYIKEDLHHSQESRPENPEGGMLCQDCHTSIEMHGDGNIFGTTLAQVEIECADCHGTPDAYPWDLLLGYGEESFLEAPPEGSRGTTSVLPSNLTFGTVYDPEDGYLLTARGNPFGNVVRRGDQVIVHSATGKDFFVPVLKTIKDEGTWKSTDSEVAMDKVAGHMEKMECYSCHADWAPQCYGCHVTVDYSGGTAGTDWVAIGNSNTTRRDGTVDTSLTTPGKVKEGRSYLRWEEPILGINGEGRVTPIIPGCQVIFSVIGPDGESVAHNLIGRTPPGTEGGGAEGQRGLDMAPAQPHTAGRKARTCESCHSDPKALGYGMQGGVFLQGYDQDRVIDLRGPDGELLPEKYSVQMPGVPDLPMDLSQVVDPETGEQLMTVGSHWPGSGPLTADQRERMERVGVCMGCHQNMADTAFWTDKVIATYGQIVTNDDHINMMNQLVHDAINGQAAMAEADAARSELSQAQAELEQVQQELEQAQEQVSAPAGIPLGYIVGGLVVGLILGLGAMALRRK